MTRPADAHVSVRVPADVEVAPLLPSPAAGKGGRSDVGEFFNATTRPTPLASPLTPLSEPQALLQAVPLFGSH